MKNEPSFDHRPDPKLGGVLRAALEPQGDHAAFVARVMAQYERALDRATIPALDILASWSRPGIAVAAAALVAGFLFGRSILTPARAPAPASIEAAMAPAEGPGGAGLAALVTADDPPDASVVYASLVDQR
jgi:hypothetical protein